MSLIDTGYGGDFDGGVLNDTGPFTTAPPDASGGSGSFLGGLLNTLTNGVNALASSRINEAVARSLGGGIASVDDAGNVTYRAAPAAKPAAVNLPGASFVQQYGLYLLVGAAVVIGAVVIARR
jgi:hypothetical protein